jgi:hypothetical protein
MSLILSGTDGLSDVDGSASTPAIRGTDTNTGIFFPAADTIAFSEGGAEAMRIDSNGDVNLYNAKSFKVYNPANTRFGSFLTNNDGTVVSSFNGSGEPLLLTSPTGYFTVSTNGSERMRIDSSGNLLLGTTAFQGGSTIGFQINATNNTSGQYAQLIKNSSGTEIFQMRCNGGLANYSANDANLSDERVKTDIKLAGSYLDKICAIPVKTFNYIDQTDDLLNLGVIAQDVEAVAPELVDIGGFGETPEDGIPLKAIYQTDLQYALMKCIQEQQAIITDLKSRIETLEAKK